MDPKTGEFHEVEEYENEREHGEPVPEEWPVFQVGEVVEIKGYEFELARVNVSNLVFRPLLPDKETSRRRVLNRMRG